MLPEATLHDMVLQAITAGTNGRPMPDFGEQIYKASATQLVRLNKGYEEARNYTAMQRRKRN